MHRFDFLSSEKLKYLTPWLRKDEMVESVTIVGAISLSWYNLEQGIFMKIN
jgi:hypothetical protein